MTAVTRYPIGRLALSAALVLPFAVMACGGDESASTIPEAEARGVASTPRPTPMSIRPLGGTAPTPPTPPTPATFGTAADAYTAGDYRAATRMYKEHLVTTPDDSRSQYMLGLSSWKSGDFLGAKEAFDKAIALDPQFLKAFLNQARVLLDLKRLSEAVEMIEKARAIDSTSGEVWRLTARAKAESGDVEGALATYRELLGRNEADAWALNNLGMLMLARGDGSAALGALARAVQVQPTAPLFLNNLGMALEASGYQVAALRRYALAVTHDSTFAKAVRNRDRLGPLVVDSALGDEVDVRELAEQFRVTVRSWKP